MNNADTVRTQLTELKNVSEGWLDGNLGVAPNHAELDWLIETYERYVPENIPNPRLELTPEGEIEAVFNIGDYEAILHIDLNEHSGDWFIWAYLGDIVFDHKSKILYLEDDESWFVITNDMQFFLESKQSFRRSNMSYGFLEASIGDLIYNIENDKDVWHYDNLAYRWQLNLPEGEKIRVHGYNSIAFLYPDNKSLRHFDTIEYNDDRVKPLIDLVAEKFPRKITLQDKLNELKKLKPGAGAINFVEFPTFVDICEIARRFSSDNGVDLPAPESIEFYGNQIMFSWLLGEYLVELDIFRDDYGGHLLGTYSRHLKSAYTTPDFNGDLISLSLEGSHSWHWIAKQIRRLHELATQTEA